MLYVNIYLISLVIVLITDVGQFFNYIEKSLGRWLKTQVSVYILECSFCQTFWTTLLYLTIIGMVSIPTIAFTLLCAALTPQTKQLITTIQDIITKALNRLNG